MKATITINEDDNLLSLREIKPKKITLATIKSFIKKNKDNLYIKTESSFNGMTDGVDSCYDQSISKATYTDENNKYNLGIPGAWFVGSSRNSFYYSEIGPFKGYEVYNCCGKFYLLTKEGIL
tara:strand:+ start:164 stop:529 length:366 start_codon:yes stop_codon:yes gene_type:complete